MQNQPNEHMLFVIQGKILPSSDSTNPFGEFLSQPLSVTKRRSERYFQRHNLRCCTLAFLPSTHINLKQNTMLKSGSNIHDE